MRVLEVHERDGHIVHTCDAPLTVGETVTGTVDFARRFDHMQQHSGEHIISGMICARYGCDNVGFHMGQDRVTIDFNHPIPPEDLPALEAEANRYVHFADCAYLSFSPNPLFDLILPAKLQTYLACGAPILAAAGGESAALIHEAQCGMAVPPQVEDLVRAVQAMAALTPEERNTMATNARQYSQEHFDKDALIDELLDLMK